MIPFTLPFSARRAAPAVASLLVLAVPATAHARTLAVSSAADFDSAVATAQAGDVIQLGAVSLPKLLIRRHVYSGTVKIVGTRATHLAGLEIKDSRNIELDG